MNIITLAFDMAAAVQEFLVKAKRFYYLVMLFGCHCPKCNGTLTMATEGRCTCDFCSYEFDPTVEFQRCSSCGGIPAVRVRRYQCKDCGKEIISTFLFEGIIFDAKYFCRKMAESRQRKKQHRERVRKMLAECRSRPLTIEPVDLDHVPGLVRALTGLTGGLEVHVPLELEGEFDLNRYQTHIRSCLEAGPKALRQMPPLIEDLRLDLIWRFVALIFLDHSRSVIIRQQGQKIWVMKFDEREGQDILGEAEEIDGIEGPEGGAQVW